MPNRFERSYQHDLDNVIDTSDAVLAIGTEKVDTTTLKDRSLNNNNGTIHGAMPSNGYFIGRRFGSNYLDCGNDSSLDVTNLTIIAIINVPVIKTMGILGKDASLPLAYGFGLALSGTKFTMYSVNDLFYSSIVHGMSANKTYQIGVSINGNEIKFYLNDSKIGDTITLTEPIVPTSDNLLIGTSPLGGYGGVINMLHVIDSALTEQQFVARFNTLARLPLYSHNFERYPNSDTSLTSVFPYTSGIITSGSFNKTDGLKCTSAGQIIFSNSFEFDGSEYITLVINGVEYSGTTTVTQGTITATIAQGSNDITIDMGTGDVLPDIRVQFREEV